jgi:hypothetical protein
MGGSQFGRGDRHCGARGIYALCGGGGVTERVKEACVTAAGYQESLLSLFSRKGETREGSMEPSRVGRRVRQPSVERKVVEGGVV